MATVSVGAQHSALGREHSQAQGKARERGQGTYRPSERINEALIGSRAAFISEDGPLLSLTVSDIQHAQLVAFATKKHISQRENSNQSSTDHAQQTSNSKKGVVRKGWNGTTI